jgi:hypothetical protein
VEKRDFSKNRREEERPIAQGQKYPLKSEPAYLKKGFRETVEDENEDVKELVFADSKSGSSLPAFGASSHGNNDKKQSPMIKSSLFSNLKK